MCWKQRRINKTFVHQNFIRIHFDSASGNFTHSTASGSTYAPFFKFIWRSFLHTYLITVPNYIFVENYQKNPVSFSFLIKCLIDSLTNMLAYICNYFQMLIYKWKFLKNKIVNFLLVCLFLSVFVFNLLRFFVCSVVLIIFL